MSTPVRSLLSFFLGMGLLLGVVGCDSGGGGVTPSTDELSVVQYIQQNPDFSILASAIGEAGLDQKLSSESSERPFTVFAPANGAFGDLRVDALTSDTDLLTQVLNFHVVPEDLAIDEIEDGQTVETLEGEQLTFQVSSGGGVTVNGIAISGRSVSAANGTVHRLDGVLLDATSIADQVQVMASTSRLERRLARRDLAGMLGDEEKNYTVFAPSNSALSAVDSTRLDSDTGLEARVLGYHVISGENIRASDIQDRMTVDTDEGTGLVLERETSDESEVIKLNGRDVISAADLTASNGTIHVVDEVLLGSANIAERTALTSATSTLFDLIQQADLDGSDGLGDESGTKYTVFAPTNSALSGIDEESFSENPSLLQKTLQYHVVAGEELRASDLVDGETRTTLEGNPVTFSRPEDGGPKVNNATITHTNVEARNGVIHLIAEPLLETTTVGERVDLTSRFSTLADLLRQANRRDLLDETDSTSPNEAPFTLLAPTDAAFDGIDTSSLTDQELRDLLDYHLVPEQRLRAEDIGNNQRVVSREGSELFFGVDEDGTVTIDNEATVTVPDLRSMKNGVVHEIDRLLMPPSEGE
ncbi:fasciclin domain-containing protein [Salinibacter sp.]|uniref:fasciclin domain-containing protein n=1 Tax=Salinibacter sp. TaxID=2065818 RepID=UPI0021E9984A|nr:fasciclin domain-containing protein [Salinibacter sp.]